MHDRGINRRVLRSRKRYKIDRGGNLPAIASTRIITEPNQARRGDKTEEGKGEEGKVNVIRAEAADSGFRFRPEGQDSLGERRGRERQEERERGVE